MNNCLRRRFHSAALALIWVSLAAAAGAAPEAKDANLPTSPMPVTFAAVKEIGVAPASLWTAFGEVLGAAGAFGVLALVVLALLRRRRARAHRLRTLFEVANTPAPLGERPMPRRLPNNPYLEPSTSGMLGRQIENAAEASVEFGRVLGIVYFDLGASPSGAFDGERGDWDAERDELMAEFKQALRPTDHVALLSDREIVACIALLPGRTELLGIAGRLRAIGQNSVRFASAFAAEAGLSIFPACGYRGEELIDYARADYRARKPAVLAPRPFRLRLVEDLAERKA